MLHRRVLSFFRRRRLVEAGDVLLVACSGGPDSTALVYVLLDLRDVLGLRMELAHLDHGLRGPAGRADARFVADLAAAHGLALHHAEASVRRGPGGESVELRGRRTRRAFLEEAARIAGARWIVTGHTADDQAETLLLNLLRGAGPRGLGGMLPVGPGRLCRPFLGTWKREILAFLEERDLPWRTDATNEDLAFRRNLVRRRVLPYLEETVHPGIRAVLRREAVLFAQLDAYLSVAARTALVEVTARGEGDAAPSAPAGSAGAPALRLRISALRRLHPALRRAVLREALCSVTGSTEGMKEAHVAGILRVAKGTSASGRLSLPHGALAERDYDDLILRAAAPEPLRPPPPPTASAGTLASEGALVRGDLHLAWRTETVDPAALPRMEAAFDPAAIVPPLILRAPRPGDRLEPFGMTGSRKLSDLFTDLKVRRADRAGIGVLCDNGRSPDRERVLWVIGVRRSRHAPVAGPGAPALVFRALRDPRG